MDKEIRPWIQKIRNKLFYSIYSKDKLFILDFFEVKKESNEEVSIVTDHTPSDNEFFVEFKHFIPSFKYNSVGEFTAALTIQHALYQKGMDCHLDYCYKWLKIYLKTINKSFLYDQELLDFSNFVFAEKQHRTHEEFEEILELNYAY